MAPDYKTAREQAIDAVLAHPMLQTIERVQERVHLAVELADAALDALGLEYVGQWCPWKGYGILPGSDEPDTNKWVRLYRLTEASANGSSGDRDV